ncbi:hypothetical protein GLOIN_2v1776934 [Rhizophagus irregularis DAOM 181602=DAOM 197198]|nr:hypothetical protein GLOIN_2v1776934 [Rhizophagus irregularis DAOM 181602=DAOM 197198]
MQHLTFSRKAFYSCRNALSIELFEQKWKSMIDLFPECQSYMTKALYPNRSSWAKSYLPFQFNGGIQSTQSVESFNAIIKKAVNSTSTLCDVEKAIDKRHESESKYCQLIDLKARQTTVEIPHLSSQFQISQSFTYEGQLVTSFIEDLESNTTSTHFVENLVDEPQVTLQSLLSGVEHIQPNEIMRQNNSKRNRSGVAFSTAKTAINVALKTKTDEKLIKILKDFIAAKHEIQSERNDHTNNNLEVNNYTEDQLRQDTSNIIIPLQQHLIGQITNPNVTKIQGAPSKKRLKSAMELSKKWIPMQKNLNDPNYQVAKSQYRYLLCGKPGHYQKKCPNARDGKYRVLHDKIKNNPNE